MDFISSVCTSTDQATICYRRGTGVERDSSDADRWDGRAVALGVCSKSTPGLHNYPSTGNHVQPRHGFSTHSERRRRRRRRVLTEERRVQFAFLFWRQYNIISTVRTILSDLDLTAI